MVVFVASWIEDMWRKYYRLYLWPAGQQICGENLIGCIFGQLDSRYVEKILSVVFLASWIVDMWRKSYRLYFWPAGQWICGENLLAQQHEWGRLAVQCQANQPSLVCLLFLLQSLQRNLSCNFLCLSSTYLLQCAEQTRVHQFARSCSLLCGCTHFWKS